MIRAAIFGGTGYGGMELLRYLLGHPDVDVTALTSRSETGPVADRYAQFGGFTELSFTKETDASRPAIARDVDVVFYAKPHGVSAGELGALLDAVPDTRFIDLSGDFRLQDATLYPEWYGFEHPSPALIRDVVYGLPELDPAGLASARLVANPGCHAVASILALHPLARAGLITGRVGIASITGSSGSGSRPKAGTHHPERFSNLKAYRPLFHQHVPEVVQALGGVTIDFVPHSAPIARGIHVTAFVPTGDADGDAVRAAFDRAYGERAFVRVLDRPPEVRAVAGTNMVDVHVTPGDGVAVVTLAIDNLGKGMAGNAVQNMNLMFGRPETAGLDRPGAGL